MGSGFPLEASFLPDIEETDQQDNDEEGNLQPAGPTKTIESDGPGEDIGSFHVEDKEKGRDKIKGNWVLKPGRAGRDDTALVGSDFLRVRFFFSEPGSKKEQSHDQDQTHQSKNAQSQNPRLPRRKNING